MQSYSGRGAPPGPSGQVSLCLPRGYPRLGLERLPRVYNRGLCFFSLNTASLLNILELPRLSEAKQPKGISLLTCEVKYCDFR